MISLIGLIFIYSATTPSSSQIIFSALFKKQFFGLLSGILIYLIFAKLSYGHLCYWGYSAYFLVILLLIFTKIKGAIGMGAQRWISLVFFRFQPSELTKLFLPSYITHYLKTVNSHPVYKFKTFVPLLMGLFLSFILILKQPDLGTASLILFSGLIVFWVAGLRTKFFIYSLLI